MPPSDLPSTLLDLVRVGVHEDGAQARDTPPPRIAPRVLDNRALAKALDASHATVGRLSRPRRVPCPDDMRRFRDAHQARAVRSAEANADSEHVPAQEDCSGGRAAQTRSLRCP